MQVGIEITGLKSSSGVLTKRISLGSDGRLISDGSACVMAAGAAKRVKLSSIKAFADLIGTLDHNEAIALGALRSELPDEVEVTTARKLSEMSGTAGPGVISRTAGHIAYAEKQAAFALLDFDTKGMPAAVTARLDVLGGFWNAVTSVLPDLGHAGYVVRRSTSSGISRNDTGEAIQGSDGLHVFVLVEDGSDIERFLRTLHDRCWLHGLGWVMVGAGGQFLERSIVDRMVYAAERLVFEGAPILTAPLQQDASLRAPLASEGQPINTMVACRSLTLIEKAKLGDLKAAERHRLGNAAAKVRQAFLQEHATKIAAKVGTTPERARRSVEKLCGGVLLPDIELPFDSDEMRGCTVGDVLADPDRFVDATLADPLEGISYGRGKAKIMRRLDGSLWVNSFAHGHTVYELRYDAALIEKTVLGAPPEGLADLFVRLLVQADISPEEEQTLRELVMERAGVKARPLGMKIKAARAQSAKEHAKTAKEHAQARRVDRRVRLPAPAPDAERLPILGALEEVLCGVEEPEPPMRDMDGHPVEVRERPPMMLHELTSGGANQTEQKDYRLPAPAMPLLTPHDRFSFAHVVERYMEFVVEGDAGSRPVALPGTFIDHFMAWRDSALPRVGAVVTAPLVLADGSMLAPAGLDRDSTLR